MAVSQPASATPDRTAIAGPAWARSYPPLVLLAVAVVVAALVLPSALNLPQSNPSTVLEYAPVPPEDDNPPPPADGNLSALGIGTSRSLTAGGRPPPPPPPPPPDEGSGSKPTAKRCIGDPPKQTEDPMSPPCVPFFEGDNFGATYQGVSRDEITVLIYLDRGCPGQECAKDSGTYDDLGTADKPRCPKTWPADNGGRNECDYPWIRTARAFNRFFNDRFQTYERTVRYWAFVTSEGTPAGRRTDAAANWNKLHPFAVIDSATYNGANEAYDAAMTARGVLVFTQQTALPNAFFRQNAPLSWAFWPDVEHWADQYSTYICTKVAPFAVSHYGKAPGVGPPNGQRRVFGFFYTTDDGEPGLHAFRTAVKDRLKRRCGVTPAAEGTFPNSGFVVKAGDTGAAQTDAVVKFQDAGVTTVLYLGGIEGRFSQIADGQGYYPEIVIAGDIENDNNVTGRRQNQSVWQNASATHFHLRLDRPEETPGWRAYREAAPNAPLEDAPFANEAYRDHFMLFQAIQVAGPRLTPESVNQGFHAIPEHTSTSPYIASCFFDPGDYTCVKDATEIWWDPAGQSPGGPEPGCWRMVRAGRRYLAGQWEGGDDVFRNRADPCTGFERRIQIDPS